VTFTVRMRYPTGYDHDDLPPELPDAITADALPVPGTALTLHTGARFIVLDVPGDVRKDGTTHYTAVLDHLADDTGDNDQWEGIDVRAIVGSVIERNPEAARLYHNDAAMHHAVEVMIGVLGRMVPLARSLGLDADTVTKLVYLTAVSSSSDTTGPEDTRRMARLNTQLFGSNPGSPTPEDLR
jgi:hypothetical protein